MKRSVHRHLQPLGHLHPSQRPTSLATASLAQHSSYSVVSREMMMVQKRSLQQNKGKARQVDQDEELNPYQTGASPGRRSSISSDSYIIEPTGTPTLSIPSSSHATPTPAPSQSRLQTSTTVRLEQDDNSRFFAQYVSSYRRHVARDLSERQQRGAGVGNVAEGYPACNDVSNAVLACWPETDTHITQDEWSKFIWNTNYPTFIGAGSVDIYLFNAGSEEIVATWRDIPNERGSIGIAPNDAWLPPQVTWTQGQTQTHSYYFIIATAGAQITGGEPHQATFEMIQTAPPSSLTAFLAAQTSASAASIGLNAASASLSSVLASLSAAGYSIDPSGSVIRVSGTGIDGSLDPSATDAAGNPRRTGTSSLQNGDGSGTDLPKWAIALIAILGAIALAAALAAIWFILGVLRKRRREEYARARGESAPGSEEDGLDQVHNSPTPLMAEKESAEDAHPSAGSAAAGLFGAGALAGLGIHRSSTPRSATDADTSDHDRSYSRFERSTSPLSESAGLQGKPSQRSLAGSAGTGAINHVDAGIIGDAFRNVLRKPEFHEHSSDEKTTTSGTNANTPSTPGGIGIAKGNPFFSRGRGSGMTTPQRVHSGIIDRTGSTYGDDAENSSEEEDDGDLTPPEASELMKSELASEGTSVRSVTDRRRPEIRHD